MTTGRVTNIQRYSVNDGYGIRTIVFLAGCTLRCFWCQNPETLGDGSPVVMFMGDSCSGCGACLSACPAGAIRASGDGFVYDREACRSCFSCVGECYFGARKASARDMTAGEAFTEILRDESFYRNSNGGLTLSGGEPLLQPDFCREVLTLAKSAGIHTAVETAGNVPRSALERVLPHVDLFLYDIKAMDAELHRKATGASNRTILDNLEYLTRTGVEIMVRVPLIPDLNDKDEFDAIADFSASCAGLRELHILPYHTLGASKYEQLDLPYSGDGVRENNEAEVERCAAYAAGKGLRVSIGGGGFAKRRAYSA